MPALALRFRVLAPPPRPRRLQQQRQRQFAAQAEGKEGGAAAMEGRAAELAEGASATTVAGGWSEAVVLPVQWAPPSR